MTTYFLVIKIQPVYFVRNSWNFFPTWVTELNIYLSEIEKNDEFNLIAISSTPCPIYLITGFELPISMTGQLTNIPIYTTEESQSREIIHGNYHWRTGYGFSYSISKHGSSINEFRTLNDYIKSNWLINKYLEFLTWFNTAYDDDLILNMTFLIAPSNFGKDVPSMVQLAVG